MLLWHCIVAYVDRCTPLHLLTIFIVCRRRTLNHKSKDVLLVPDSSSNSRRPVDLRVGHVLLNSCSELQSTLLVSISLSHSRLIVSSNSAENDVSMFDSQGRHFAYLVCSWNFAYNVANIVVAVVTYVVLWPTSCSELEVTVVCVDKLVTHLSYRQCRHICLNIMLGYLAVMEVLLPI